LNTAWFIAKRISGGDRQSFSRFIITIAIASNALSMAVMVIAICMVSGFTKEIRDKVFGFWGHIQVRQFQNNDSYEEKPITINAKLEKEIYSVAGVSNVASFVTKAGIIRTKEALEGIVIKGVNHQYDWSFLQQYLKDGQVPAWTAEPSRDILVSKITAQRIQVKVDDPLIVYFLPTDGSRPIGRKFRVSGIYHTGLEEYDRKFALTDQRILQELNNWDSLTVSGYEVKLNNLEKLEDANREIYEKLDASMDAQTIRELQPNIFDWLELQVMTETFALILMLLVAVMNMITALLILILDRTRMIGVLKALGAENSLIRRIFLWNAVVILVAGLMLGNLIGLGICWLQKTTGFIQLDEAAYYFTEAPIHFDWLSILGVNALTIAITLLVLLFPAKIISGISPVKAIRYD
jgi:lipoprotein-releasing system permease protein